MLNQSICLVLLSLISISFPADAGEIEVFAGGSLGWGSKIHLPDGSDLTTSFNVLPGVREDIKQITIPVEHSYVAIVGVGVIKDLVSGTYTEILEQKGKEVTFAYTYSSDALKDSHTLAVGVSNLGSPVQSTFYFESRGDLTLRRSITTSSCIWISDDDCIIANFIVGPGL